MFCTFQVILIKSCMCPSKGTFSVVDIVSEGIQEFKEAGDPSRHFVVQPLPIFLSASGTLLQLCTHVQYSDGPVVPIQVYLHISIYT